MGLTKVAESVVDAALMAAVSVLFAGVGFTILTTAAERTNGAVRQHLSQIVAVRDVRAEHDRVSGALVNLSTRPVRSVRVRIARSWVSADERRAGGAEESPGRTAVHAVPGEIAPGGRLPFTYRSDAPVPQRGGHFETLVSVVGLEEIS
jgi:hypothetical protein